jgi:hypothetical protein
LDRIINSGTTPIQLGSFALSGVDGAAFSVIPQQPCLSALAPGASCYVELDFSPTRLGSYSAALTVTDSISNIHQSVQLVATGITASPIASPTSLYFPDTPYNTPSAPLPFTVTNPAGNPVTVAITTSTGDPSPFHITQGASCQQFPCQVSITFIPTFDSGGASHAVVTDQVTGLTASVYLGGNGVGP